jgi:multiple sugar transport system permease protein
MGILIIMNQTSSKHISPAFLLGKTGAYAILILGLVATLLPFFYILLSSLKPDAELRQTPPDFLPHEPTFNYYSTILRDEKIPLERNVMNSAFVALMRVAITLFTSSFAGYIFAKYHFKGKNLAFGVILIQIMIPFQVVMIPNYLLIVRFGLIDSLWALILPSMVDAFGIFLMKQFIESLPAELMDAARIDGASEFGIYWRIVLPQMGPPLASLGIFTFMATWNDYLWPLIVLTTPEKRTIPLLVVWFQTQHSGNDGLILAASILTLIPIFFVYIFLQRWIVDQATQSAFK